MSDDNTSSLTSFLPLGGCGEIGMNLNLFSSKGRWLMVDCGITFEQNLQDHRGRPAIQLPDPSFIARSHLQNFIPLPISLWGNHPAHIRYCWMRAGKVVNCNGSTERIRQRVGPHPECGPPYVETIARIRWVQFCRAMTAIARPLGRSFGVIDNASTLSPLTVSWIRRLDRARD